MAFVRGRKAAVDEASEDHALSKRVDLDRLRAHSAELKARAAELERTMDPVIAPPPVVEVQMQVQQQQQQQTEAPQAVAPEDQKSEG
jgi:hypothetical protein